MTLWVSFSHIWHSMEISNLKFPWVWWKFAARRGEERCWTGTLGALQGKHAGCPASTHSAQNNPTALPCWAQPAQSWAPGGTLKCVRGITRENGGLRKGKLRLLWGGGKSGGNWASLVLLLTRRLHSSSHNSLEASWPQRKKEFLNHTVPVGTFHGVTGPLTAMHGSKAKGASDSWASFPCKLHNSFLNVGCHSAGNAQQLSGTQLNKANHP